MLGFGEVISGGAGLRLGGAEGRGDEALLTGELLLDDPVDFLPPIRPKLRDESKLLPADEDEDGEDDADNNDEGSILKM